MALSPNEIECAKVRSYAALVAAERGWPKDWLNDGAKGYISPVSAVTAIFDAPGIRVSRPAYEQLLAMKLCAWRDDVDIADAHRLLQELPSDREKVWQMVEPFLQKGRELVARFAFDDLWESRS